MRRTLAPLIVLLASVTASAAEPFTLVVLPDTQEYVDRRTPRALERAKKGLEQAQHFVNQTRWAADNLERMNTKMVLHLGDITQTDDEGEWELARQAMAALKGKVPICMCLGNHDMGCMQTERGWNSAQTRETKSERFFPRADVADEPWFGGSFDDTLSNYWTRFEASGMKFMVVSLEFKPRDEALEWAGKVIQEHPDHRVILITHAYMASEKDGNKRLGADHYKGYKVEGNTGEQMWDKLARKHANIFMVLCGHYLGEGRRESKGDHGNTVHEVLSDYQHLSNGGDGWLRYMTFDPDADKIEVYTYSPSLDRHDEKPSSRFTLAYEMSPAEASAVESR